MPYYNCLNHKITNVMRLHNIKTVHTIPHKLNTLIKNGKDTNTKGQNTGIVYQIKSNYEKCYIGETKSKRRYTNK